MKTPILGLSYTTGPSVSATNFSSPMALAANTWGATESQNEQVVAVAGTISALDVAVAVAPGAGKSLAFTLRVNEADTLLTVTISDTNLAPTSADTTHSISVSPGDRVCIKCIPTGTPTAPTWTSWSMEFTGTTAGESPLLGGSGAATQAAGVTDFYGVQYDASGQTTESNRYQVFPTGGTIDHLYVSLDADPGGSSQSVTVALMLNSVAQTLTIPVNTGATAANDTTHSIAIAAGDLVSWRVITSASCATVRIKIGCRWVPTIDGEAVLLSSVDTLAQALTNYRAVGGNSNFNATETNRYQISTAFTAKKLYVNASGIASGQTYATTFRKNQSSTGCPTVTITGTATTGNDTSSTVSVAARDLIDLQNVTGATSGSVTARKGIVALTASAASSPTLTQLERGIRGMERGISRGVAA